MRRGRKTNIDAVVDHADKVLAELHRHFVKAGWRPIGWINREGTRAVTHTAVPDLELQLTRPRYRTVVERLAARIVKERST